jgi:UDP-glucose 4-epimerase
MTEPRYVAVVTGGAGFIGSHIADLLLARGFEVRIVDNLVGGHLSNLAHHKDNPRVSLVQEDVRELQKTSSIFKDASYVFHLAAIGDIVPSIERPADYMDTNVQGTVRVLECARHAGVRKFIYAASSSCYGIATTPTAEDHPIAPQYPYALSKYLGEQTAFHWRQVYGLPVNSICTFNAYGTRGRTTGAYGAVFGVFLRQKLAGKPFTVVGDGTQSRDFVYVTDVAEAFLAAAESDIEGERFNVGAGRPQTINRLVELLGGGDVTFMPKRPGEPDCTFADITRIRSRLGWQPKVTFEDGVSRMLAEIERWRDAPLWAPESIAHATQTWFRYLGGKSPDRPVEQ